MIRLDSKEERDRWITCLNDSASLTIKDLYSYDEENPVGQGRYASVYRARRQTEEAVDIEEQPYNCAIKVIDKNAFWRRVVKGLERADTLVREVSVQATLTAKCSAVPTFLRLQSMFETTDNVVIELELVEGTDLFHYIWSKKFLYESEAADIMKDILISLDVMNRIGLAHRDIKPANMLMCDKEKHGALVKIGDFGMSTFAGIDGLVRGRCGTPGYVGPEIFSAGIHGGYGNKVDVFSAGVTLYLMLCGYEPFYGETDSELIAANKEAHVEFEGAAWTNVSPEAKDLLRSMLAKDPKQRISAKDALQHPWITKNSTTIHDIPTQLPQTLSGLPSDGACVIS
jgi:serine/threonine protein kinase